MKMKNTALLSIYIFLSGCVSNNEKSFYKNILNDGARNSYYILTRVKTGSKEKLYIVNNYDLFGYFFTNGMAEEQYVNKAYSILIKKEAIEIDSSQQFQSIFKCLDPQKVKALQAKGADQIISQYFKGSFIKEGVSFEDQYHIIGALFTFQIATRQEDETGYLTYDRDVVNF